MRTPDFERLRMTLLGEGEPDRVPFYEVYVDNEVMEALTGDPITQMSTSNKKDLERYLESTVKFYHDLGYDYVSLRISPDFQRDNILLSQDTAIMARGKRQWLDEHRGIIEDQEDLEEYPWPNPEDLANMRISHIKILRKMLPEGMKMIPYTSGIFENVMRLLGTIPFLHKLYRDPVLVRDMFDKVGSIISFYIGVIAEEEEVGAVAYNDDMGYKSGPIISPGFLRRYVFPWQKRCVETVHRKGKPFILHSCGNLGLIMNDLIDYVGIDAKHSYEDSTYPVTEYKKLYGDRIALLGGVAVDKLARFPQPEFRSYVEDVIHKCAPGGNYALGSGNTVTNYVRLENYLAMLEVGRKCGRYPMK